MAVTKLSIYDQVKGIAAGGTAAFGDMFVVNDTAGAIVKATGLTYDLSGTGTLQTGFYFINKATINGFSGTAGSNFITSSVATNNTTLNYSSPYMAQQASIWSGSAAVSKAFVWSVGQISGTNSAYALNYDSTDMNNIFQQRGDTGLVSIKANTGNMPAVPAAGTLLQIAAADGDATRIVNESFGAANAFSGRRANGTAASKTGVVANDVLCQLTATGYNSAAAYGAVCADIRILANETHSGTIAGSAIIFRTTQNGTLTLAEKVRIGNDGVITVNGTAANGGRFFNLFSGINGIGILTTDYVVVSSGTGLFLGLGANTGNTVGTIDAQLGAGGAANLVLQNNSGGFVGIRTATPQHHLDIAGFWGTRETVINLVNGANQNVAITSSWILVNGPTGAYNIGGIAAGHDGQLVTFFNNTTQIMTINHQDAGSSAGNKLSIKGGVNVAVGAGFASFTVQYSTNLSAWIVLRYTT